MRKRALSRVAAAIALAFSWADVASAAITVVPRDPYKVRTSDTIYYAGATIASPALASNAFVDTDAGYQKILMDDDSSTDSDKSSMLVFDVQSDQDEAGLGDDDDDDVLVVVAEAQLEDDEFVPIRIAAASFIDSFDDDDDPSFCVEGSNCQGQGTDLPGDPSGLFAAKYQARRILRIGIYPKELCESADDQATEDAEGCSGSSVSATFPLFHKIRITVTVAEDGDELGDLENEDAEISDTLTLHFQNDPPSFTCPASFVDSYFPGDKEIYLDTGFFEVDEPASGGADVERIIVVGDSSGTVDDDEGTYDDNEIVARPKVNQDAARINGFTNGTATTLCFGGRDDAGIIAVAGAGGICDCTLAGIETANVSGFLEDSNCFIASASFRSNDASPVRMLRRFRDRVLSRFAAGRAFISSYYEHSPAAARWLLDHPAARIPVLGLLIPVQGIAWLALHPAIALGFAGAGAGAALGGLVIRRRRRRTGGG